LVDPLPGISDPVIGWPNPANPGVLAPGQSVTGRATYALTQADVDRGFISNIADVAALAPGNVPVTATTNEIIVTTVSAVRQLQLVKVGTATGVGGPGDLVNYRFTARNTGNVTLTAVGIADTLPGLSALSYGAWPDPANPGVLAPGQFVVATADYLLGQGDVDTGSVTNTASAIGSPPNGAAPVTTLSNQSIVTTVKAAPAVSITNRGELAPGATGRAGDIVNWTYVFTNDGNVSLTGVALADAVSGVGAPAYTWAGTIGTLAPGQSVTGRAQYTLTQGDVDSGSVSSLVTGTGQVPSGGAPATASAPATVAITPNPALVLVKAQSLVVAGQNGEGDLVTYDFEITNSGSVTLTEVTIVDALPAVGAIGYIWPGVDGVLRPGQSATATASYRLSQDDVDRGFVDNRATVTGLPPTGPAASADSNTVTTVTENQVPSIATAKSGSYRSGSGEVGSVIGYRFEITNTGNVTLNLIALREALAGVSRPVITFPSASGILGPGDTAIGTATYTVTQADVDRGSISNQATATGTSPRGVVVTGPSNTSVISTAPGAPAITTTHTAALAPGAAGVLGDRVDYTFEITNSGNQSLNGVTLANTLTDLSGFTYTWPAAAGVLLPGQKVSITASRAVTQADIDAGRILNIATGSGNSPSTIAVTDDSPQTVITLAAALGALSITKSGTPAGGAVGDTVTYTFVVKNTGPVTVTDLAISDPKLGTAPITYGTWPATAGTLAPGAEVSATAEYVITQTDVDSGAVRNTASVSGNGARGGVVSKASNASVVATVLGSPGITLTKTQPLAAGAAGRAGDAVNFSYTVTNDGNVTLTGVTIADPQSGLGTLVYVWPNPALPGTLLPGESATATVVYLLTQSDVDAGGIASTATASGTAESTTVTSQAAGSTPVAANPAMTIAKSHSVETFLQQGGGILYRIAVTNTGNVTMTGVTITDPKPGLTPLATSWPGAPGTLTPGQVAVATARYVLTQADVDAGTLGNTAAVTGAAPGGREVSETTTHDIAIPRVAAIALTMDISLAPGATGATGDRLFFRHLARNSGTETLRGVTISDLYPGLSDLEYAWPGDPGVLLPGQSVVATGTVVITAAMVGSTVSSTATVSAIAASTSIVVRAAAADTIVLPTLAVPRIPGLPNTGSAPLIPSAFALLLILAGLVLTVGARRRARRATFDV
uniref:beta strand repeat-containing protein n=1 Tax=Salinibacterium sp. TaxID=1915057 RepID=UPI0037C6CBEA